MTNCILSEDRQIQTNPSLFWGMFFIPESVATLFDTNRKIPPWFKALRHSVIISTTKFHDLVLNSDLLCQCEGHRHRQWPCQHQQHWPCQPWFWRESLVCGSCRTAPGCSGDHFPAGWSAQHTDLKQWGRLCQNTRRQGQADTLRIRSS